MRVTIDVCHSRIQLGEPPFVVTTYDKGDRKYKFFRLRFQAEDYKNKLLKL